MLARRVRLGSRTGTEIVAEQTSPAPSERAQAAARLWIDLFGRHDILNNASAIAFQALKALVPLALFALALPGIIGFDDIWENRLRESVSRQLTPTAFEAVDTAVRNIEREGGVALPILAGALLLWYVSGLVRACMGGINAIHEVDDTRPLLKRWGLSLAIAVVVILAVVGAILAFTVAPRIERTGMSHALLLVVRWPVAALLLGLAVGVLVHYGSAAERPPRWTSLGAVAVVTAWICQAFLFGWFVTTFANFKSASGALVIFLVLAGFLYTSSIIFLVGVQIDELLRKDASEDETGIVGVLLRGRQTS